MSAPSSKAKQRKPREPRAFVPHPDDEPEVRSAVEAVERGEMMSVEESAAYLRELLGERESVKR